MSRTHNDVALRRQRGHDSTASFVHLEGQKVLSKQVQTKLDRIRQGLCPTCAKPVTPEVAAGKLLIRGRVVHRCEDCRINRQLEREDRKKRKEADVARQTLIGERLQQADEIGHAKKLFDTKPNATILIVGGRTTNIQRAARSHPRVLVWESTHIKDRRLPTIPSNVAIAICTRFMSHQQSDEIRTQSQTRGVFQFSGLLQSGEIRRHLTTLLNLDVNAQDDDTDDSDDPPMPTPVAAPKLVAAPQPPPTTRPAPVAMPALSQEPERMTLPTPQPIVFPADGDLDSKIDGAISMVGDAIAALSLVKEQLEMTRVSIAQSTEGMKKLRMLKELLGQL